MNKKLFLPLILFVGLIVAFMIQLNRNAAGDDPKHLDSALIGHPVPTFSKTSLLNNQPIAALPTGKPYLLNVWATWCPTCYAEHGYLVTLAKQGVNIIGIDYKDTESKAKQFIQSNGNPYKEIIFDENGGLGLDLGVYGAPETFLVDSNGIIHYRHAGDVNERVWNETLKPIYEKLK